MNKKNWFKKWFDSPYYHVLYRHRDQREAEFFINHLVQQLHLPPHAFILDMACGRGRHCIFLNKRGYDVTGIDIAEENIREAKKNENKTLSFFLHDMRKPFRINYFDCVLNLFTSFGYFSNPADNERVVRNACAALKPGGFFVLDFMNSTKVIQNLVAEERKTIDGIPFRIKKYVRGNYIFKEIAFNAEGKNFFFTERVQAISTGELEKYFGRSGLKVIHLWGDYELKPFDEDHSERVIVAGEKA